MCTCILTKVIWKTSMLLLKLSQWCKKSPEGGFCFGFVQKCEHQVFKMLQCPQVYTLQSAQSNICPAQVERQFPIWTIYTIGCTYLSHQQCLCGRGEDQNAHDARVGVPAEYFAFTVDVFMHLTFWWEFNVLPILHKPCDFTVTHDRKGS